MLHLILIQRLPNISFIFITITTKHDSPNFFLVLKYCYIYQVYIEINGGYNFLHVELTGRTFSRKIEKLLF